MGWLGWTPDVVLDANIQYLRLAIAGKIDFLKKTNPWGDGKEETAPPPSPELGTMQFMAFVDRQLARQRRKGKPRK